jgi:hypothetical protein
MKISFTPQRSDRELLLSVSGEVLTINGTVYDLSVIPEGASLNASATDSDALFNDISRDNGELSLTILLQHKADPHKAISFPESVSVTNGVVVDTANSIYPWSLA